MNETSSLPGSFSGSFRGNLAICLAGLLGAGGVATGAAAAHTGGAALLETASHYALIHASATLALAFNIRKSSLFLAATWLLLIGAGLFCGDLTLRAMAGTKLFAMAAPSGGMLLIAGWLAAGCGGIALLFRVPRPG